MRDSAVESPDIRRLESVCRFLSAEMMEMTYVAAALPMRARDRALGKNSITERLVSGPRNGNRSWVIVQ